MIKNWKEFNEKKNYTASDHKKDGRRIEDLIERGEERADKKGTDPMEEMIKLATTQANRIKNSEKAYNRGSVALGSYDLKEIADIFKKRGDELEKLQESINESYNMQYSLTKLRESQIKTVKLLVKDFVRSLRLSWFNDETGEMSFGWDSSRGGNPLEKVDQVISYIKQETYIDYHLYPQLRTEKSSQFTIYPIDTTNLGK